MIAHFKKFKQIKRNPQFFAVTVIVSLWYSCYMAGEYIFLRKKFQTGIEKITLKLHLIVYCHWFYRGCSDAPLSWEYSSFNSVCVRVHMREPA